MSKLSTLVVVAVDQELPMDLPMTYIKSVVGVGKVNAAINTMKSIMIAKPERVINYGTAGSLNPDYGQGLYKIARVVQRDFDARPLASDIGIVPFDNTGLTITLAQGNGPTLSSGDNFVTETPEVHSDLVDMEGWAIAKVCKELGIALDMYKYVTDSADDKAPEDWKKNLQKGAEEFLSIL